MGKIEALEESQFGGREKKEGGRRGRINGKENVRREVGWGGGAERGIIPDAIIPNPGMNNI